MKWQIRCPDGKLRHYPYINRGDADFDAQLYDTRGDCKCKDAPHVVEPETGPLRGGVPHTFDPESFN